MYSTSVCVCVVCIMYMCASMHVPVPSILDKVNREDLSNFSFYQSSELYERLSHPDNWNKYIPGSAKTLGQEYFWPV